MTDEITFHPIGRFLDSNDYEVHGDGAPYRITVREAAGDYERSIFNGDDVAWQRDAVSAIGFVVRSIGPEAISQAVVDRFNAWRAADHAREVREMRSQPELFGEISDVDPRLQAPPVVRGARYERGVGWVDISTPITEMLRQGDSSTVREPQTIGDLFMYRLA